MSKNEMRVGSAPLSDRETGDLTDGEMKCDTLELGLEMHDMTGTADNVQNKELVYGLGIEHSMTQGLAKNVVISLKLSPVTLPTTSGTIGLDNSVSKNVSSKNKGLALRNVWYKVWQQTVLAH